MASCPRCNTRLNAAIYYRGAYLSGLPWKKAGRMRCSSCGLKIRFTNHGWLLGAQWALFFAFAASGYLVAWSYAPILLISLFGGFVITEAVFWHNPGAVSAPAIEQ